MQSVSPVFTEKEVPLEKDIAKNQNQYLGIIGLPISLAVVDKESKQTRVLKNWGMAVRFRLDEAERAAIAQGHDIVVTQLNFGEPITPMNFQILPAGKKPVFGEEVALPTAYEQAGLPAPERICEQNPRGGPCLFGPNGPNGEIRCAFCGEDEKNHVEQQVPAVEKSNVVEMPAPSAEAKADGPKNSSIPDGTGISAETSEHSEN